MPSSWCAWIELKCATSRFASTLFRSATNSASPIVPPTTSAAGLSSGSSSSFSSPAGLCSSSSDCASGEVSRSRLRSRSAVRKREKSPRSAHSRCTSWLSCSRRAAARVAKMLVAVRGDVLQLALALKRSCNARRWAQRGRGDVRVGVDVHGLDRDMHLAGCRRPRRARFRGCHCAGGGGWRHKMRSLTHAPWRAGRVDNVYD
ncbi:hypothetical protein L1887_42351 [Cichorium endivia]|nr:hypothetical protein L1887_42351 [Cichorium endivia]